MTAMTTAERRGCQQNASIWSRTRGHHTFSGLTGPALPTLEEHPRLAARAQQHWMYLEKCAQAGQTAFVTGGGRGIGLAAAEALLEAGAKDGAAMITGVSLPIDGGYTAR